MLCAFKKIKWATIHERTLHLQSTIAKPELKKLFQRATDMNVDGVVGSRASHVPNTTKFELELCGDFMGDNELICELDCVSKERWCPPYSSYMGIRWRDEETYQHASFLNTTLSKGTQHGRALCAVCDPEFKSANGAFSGTLKKLRRSGVVRPTWYNESINQKICSIYKHSHPTHAETNKGSPSMEKNSCPMFLAGLS